MSWQGSTYQLVVWIQPLGTVLGILIPLANRQEGTTEKMLLFGLENDGVEYVQLLSTQKANSLRIASHLWIPLFSTELFWQLKNSSLWMAVGRY